MENKDYQKENQINLGRIILRGKESNAVLRETANHLYETVKKLKGEFPREINDYDKKDKKSLTYLEMLEMNADYFDIIIEDILYTLNSLNTSVN